MRNCAWPVVLETCDVIPGPRRLALGARRPLPSPIPRRPGFYIQSLLYVGPGCCVLCGIGAASCPVSPARCRLPGVACPVSPALVRGSMVRASRSRHRGPRFLDPDPVSETAENCQKPPKIGPRAPWRRLRPRSAQITPGKTI